MHVVERYPTSEQLLQSTYTPCTFRRLREILDVRETELIGQLDLETQDKLKGLAAQRDQIETTLAKLQSCLHYMRECLQTGNEGDVLMMKANTHTQIKELTTPFQSDILEPIGNGHIRTFTFYLSPYKNLHGCNVKNVMGNYITNRVWFVLLQ